MIFSGEKMYDWQKIVIVMSVSNENVIKCRKNRLKLKKISKIHQMTFKILFKSCLVLLKFQLKLIIEWRINS